MKFKMDDFPKIAKTIRSTDVYDVHDLRFLQHLVTSMTELHAGQETKGHKHDEQEEVYIFLDGKGRMQLGNEEFDVKEYDVVLIPGGKFHKVYNPDGPEDLKFFCIFEDYGER